jgi:hypothetical protein
MKHRVNCILLANLNMSQVIIIIIYFSPGKNLLRTSFKDRINKTEHLQSNHDDRVAAG